MSDESPADTEFHRLRHVALHKAFDELIADYIQHTPGAMLTNTTVMELVEWSHAQTVKPDHAYRS